MNKKKSWGGEKFFLPTSLNEPVLFSNSGSLIFKKGIPLLNFKETLFFKSFKSRIQNTKSFDCKSMCVIQLLKFELILNAGVKYLGDSQA